MKATFLGFALIIALTGFVMPFLVETPIDSMQQRLVQVQPTAGPCVH